MLLRPLGSNQTISMEESAVIMHAELRSLLILGLSVAPAVVLADVGDAVTIASGLANPRGIAFAPNGALYVAEAGSGGPGPCIPSPVPTNGNRCYGETGAVTRILKGEHVGTIVR